MSRLAAYRGSEFLLDANLAHKTRDDYLKAVCNFVDYCEQNGEDWITAADLDAVLTEYFHACFVENEGKGKQAAVNTRSGLIHLYPELKNELARSSRALRGWSKLKPSTAYPPLTWHLSVLIAVRMVLDGRYRYAVGVLLAFDCLLRVGELVKLRREDITDLRDARVGSEYRGVGLRLRMTKTGPNKWVEVRDTAVQQLISGVLRSTPRGGLLFPFSTDQFRSVLKATCRTLGLDAGYVPHSLRHGGATRLSLLGWKVEDIRLRGRWATSKSTEHYIQSGRAMLLSVSVPEQMARLGELFANGLIHSISLAQKH